MVGAASEQMGLNLKAVNAPRDLVLTNRVYAAVADVKQLCGHSEPPYVEIRGCYFSLERHQNIDEGTIAFNKMQREFAKIAIESVVHVRQFTPPQGFNIDFCKMEVDFYTKPAANTKRIEIKAEELEEMVQLRFQTHIFCDRQIVPIDYNGINLKL